MGTALIVLLVVVVLIVMFAVGIYNRLVSLRNRFRNAFAQIDVQLKRRYDLIPNLVETARGYLRHERETLEAVIAARNLAANAEKQAGANPGNAEALKNLSGAESALSGVLGRLMVVVERYPDLKANQTMEKLMEELSSTENRIAFARQAFNDAVMTYNTRVESFPDLLIAGAGGFTRAGFFEIEKPAEKEAPAVSFTA
jgi:LemA protein